MSSAVYSLPITGGAVLDHWGTNTSMLCDGNDRVRELRAQVQSGDYFIMLATMLDAITLELGNTNPAVNIVLENIIKNLEYLQEDYTIVERPIRS